jgi:hypothetical protein
MATAQQVGQILEPLPHSLPNNALADNPLLAARATSSTIRKSKLDANFFAGLSNHSRPNFEHRIRIAVSRYARQRKQYIRCELLDGRVLVGTVGQTSSDEFGLNIGVITTKWIKYSELASEPRPVEASGQKFVRGMEIFGMFAVVIITAPIVIPLVTISCATGSCPD